MGIHCLLLGAGQGPGASRGGPRRQTADAEAHSQGRDERAAPTVGRWLPSSLRSVPLVPLVYRSRIPLEVAVVGHTLDSPVAKRDAELPAQFVPEVGGIADDKATVSAGAFSESTFLAAMAPCGSCM